MKTAVDYLLSKGWKISSDPRYYEGYPENYGLRNFTQNGINYDSFCGGYHRAFDFYSNETNDVPAITSGTVITSEPYGNFGGTVEIRDANGNDWIYGHLQRNSLRFSKGDKVNQGDIIGLQGSSNFADLPMAVHLHLQLRPKGVDLANEKSEVCSGIPIEKYDISKLNQKMNKSNNGGNRMTQIVTSIVPANVGGMTPVGVVIHNDAGTLTGVGYKNFLANHPLENGFAHYYVSEGSILQAQYTDRVAWHTGNQWGNGNLIGFEVCQSMNASDEQFLRNEEETFKLVADVMKSYNIPINEKTVWLHKELSPTACPHRSWDLHGKSVASVKKYFVERIRYYANGGSVAKSQATVKPVKKPNVQKTPIKVKAPKVNINVDRGRSAQPYFMGTIDNLGAEVRKRSGNKIFGFNWNKKSGYNLKAGDVVYIFEQHKGWGRIYTGELKGNGSNDWVWLGRVKPTKVFK